MLTNALKHLMEHVLADKEHGKPVWLYGKHSDEPLASKWRICLESW